MMYSKAVSVAFSVGALALILEAAPRQILPNHVPQAVSDSRRMGSLSRARRLDLAIGLPLRNAEELDLFLAQVTDPGSPNYRQYLSASEFAERFGPTQDDYDKLIAFFQASGFAVTGTHPNRMILDVSGPVTAIEEVAHINMVTWEHPTRGEFFAPDRDPWLDVDVDLLSIAGLDNFMLPRPIDTKTLPLGSAAPFTSGSGPSGLFIGKDFRAAYAPGVSPTGAGQSVGLFELDGFFAGDVQANFQKAGLPVVPVGTVLLNGFNGSAGSSNLEVILDIMMAAYMAPGASILVYEGRNWDDILNRMATDNTARQLSSSWCFSPIDATTEQIFKQMIAQGQSFFQASGDSGAYSGYITPPADDPNVTVVGGTALSTAGAGGQWQSESAWGGSGGGASTTYAIPSYQQGMNMAALGGSNTMRNIPDVALTAAVQMYVIYNNGQATAVGGTSAAAPLWAGYTALANEQAAANGKAPVGFLNPALYALGHGASYASAMHDITAGSNGYAAIPGFDLATGWGTPAGQALLNVLSPTATTPSFTLSATPGAVPVATGSSATATVQVTAVGGFSGTVTLSVTGLPSGVTGTFGALNASGASTLTLAASATAALGNATLTVTGKSGTLSATTVITLTVSAPSTLSLAASVSTLSVAEGAGATATITVTPKAGFSGQATLTASGLPAGVTASFNPATTATTSIVTFSAASSAAMGTSTVTVTGTAGTSSATVKIAVTVTATPGFTLGASPASLTIAQGASGTSTLTVTPTNGFTGTANLTIAGLPTGVTAAFSPASTSSTSKLTLTASASAPAGTATVTVTAASGSISAKATVSLTVTGPSFRLSSSVPNVNVTLGGSGTASIGVLALGGFTGTVTFAAAGLPAGVSASFSPAGSATASTLTLTAASSAALKTSQITINGTSGSLTASVPVTVTVTPPPDFAMVPIPASLTLLQGGRGATAISIAAIAGFTGKVTLSASGLPAGVTASFSASSSSTLLLGTFTAAGSAAAGTAKVTVTGTSGSLSHTAILSLTVAVPPAATAAVDLSSYYNVPASAVDNLPFTSGGLDALGRSYSGVLLGASQSVAGTAFSLGPMGVADAVSGQTVTLPAGQFTSLKMLATAVNGNQPGQTFTVTYTDGTTSKFTQSLSDWYTPQVYAGESQAVTMNYRDNSTGTTDGRTFYLYGYSFTLNGAKTVKSVALPQNRNVVVLAITLAGSAPPLATAVQVDLSKAFNGIGITSDGKPFTGGLDGVGNTYSGSLLVGTPTFNGVRFQMGSADQADVVSGTASAIALPAGKYSGVSVLATAVNGAQVSQPFKVTYTDGTSATFTQSLSDWFNPAGFPGELTALAMPYRNFDTGVKDNRPFELYQYTFTLNNSKTVSSIALPAANNVKVFAITLKP